MRTVNRWIAAIVVSISITSCTNAQASKPNTTSEPLDAYVERALKTFEVPGMAVAVVKGGKVVYAKGFGVRRLGSPDKVDANTLFQIGSTTKAMTVAALATLVDQGKLKWDGPVRDYMPSFQMYDPYVSKEITVRDILTHRSGLGMGEGDLLLFPPSNLTRPQLIARMKNIKPLWSFRTHWAYCNLCFVTAGELIPAITGKSWEEYIQSNVFRPLGMNDTRVTVSGMKPTDNIAAAHEIVDGKVTIVPWDVIDNAAPAGAVVSSVNDMSKWIAVQLNHGKLPNGERLFTEADSREMWSGVSLRPLRPATPGFELLRKNFNEYALGWGVWDYRGQKIIEHSGGVTGMITEVVLVPGMDLGLVLFANTPANNELAVPSVMYRVLDEYLGAGLEDWTSKYKVMQQKMLQDDANEQKKAATSRDADSKPSLALEKYAGEYSDPWFGEARLTMENGKLVFSVPWSPRLIGDVEHWQHDTFVIHFRDKTVPDSYLYFSMNPDNSIERAKMAPVSALADFSYDFQDLELKPVGKPPAK
jgi:CubicO group peptidase (beta-lactamase class C family)